MTSRRFSTRRFQTSDVDSIVELLESVFDSDFSRDWWDWKYLQNPAGFQGEEGDVWIAEAHGEVIGHYAVIPERMKIASQTITVAQAVDAATSPDYRRCGVFTSLMKKILSDVKKHYDFLFAFPGELNRDHGKLGWNVCRMNEFLNIIDYQRLSNDYFKNGAVRILAKMGLKTMRAGAQISSSFHSRNLTGSDAQLEEIISFSRELDEFWKLIEPEHEVILTRDSLFLNWRFSEHFGDYRKIIARSTETGEVLGYVVVTKAKIKGTRQILDLVDLQVLPGEDKSLAALVTSVMESAKTSGFDMVRCRVPQWHKYAELLRRLKFISLGRVLEWGGLYQPRLIVKPLAQAEAPDFDRWFYTLADTDNA